jgi:hypothetical protein
MVDREVECSSVALLRGSAKDRYRQGPPTPPQPPIWVHTDAGSHRRAARPRPFPFASRRCRDPFTASRDEASFLVEFGPRLADIRRRTLPVAQRREFKWYCRLASHLAGDDLKNELEARARADDSVLARRARLVLGAIVRKQKPTPQD